MSSLAELEEQLVYLNALSKASTKTLDAFSDVSHSIAVKAQQIYSDAKPWEVSLSNIASTIAEVSKAAKCYHQPPFLKAVLSGEDTGPQAIAESIDYLVYTEEYLSLHPPKEYELTIRSQLDSQLRRIVEVSERYIRNAFIQSVRKENNPSSVAFSTNRSVAIINAEALEGVPIILRQMVRRFDCIPVIKEDVKQLLEEELRNFVKTAFSTRFMEGEGKRGMAIAAYSGSVSRPYHRGEHSVLDISKEVRRLIKGVANSIDQFIIQPLEENEEIASIPADLSASVFNVIFDQALTIVHFDQSILGDPTSMFLHSHGQGIGLSPSSRPLQNIIFIGLDLLEEIWMWKELVNDLPGENGTVKAYVASKVDQFVLLIRKLLHGYMHAVGRLSNDRLRHQAQQRTFFEWFPNLDCTAHESSTNFLYFHKTLFTSFYGALKLVLYGCFIDSSSEYVATKEVEDFLFRSISGHMRDIVTVGIVAKELLNEIEPRRGKRGKGKKANLSTSSVSSGYLSLNVFTINNALFLSQSLRKLPCFTRRKIPTPLHPEGLSVNDLSLNVPKEEYVIQKGDDYLKSVVSRCIEAFEQEWLDCFPPTPRDETMVDSEAEEKSLKKNQVIAFKNWYSCACKNIRIITAGCRGEAVMDSDVRLLLVRIAYEAVEKTFFSIESLVKSYLNGEMALLSSIEEAKDALAGIRTIF